jgi:hypothetical protein
MLLVAVWQPATGLYCPQWLKSVVALSNELAMVVVAVDLLFELV